MMLIWGRGRLFFFFFQYADHGPHCRPDFVEVMVLSANDGGSGISLGFQTWLSCFLTVQSWESNF